MMVLRLMLAALLMALGVTPALALDVKTLASPKGEQVWYVEDHSLPMIALSASLPAGSAYDPAAKAGLAAFAAALADEGAGRLDSEAFQAALNDRAIRLSFSAGRDHLNIQLVTLASHADEAFRLLGLALSSPRFDAVAIARVRAQILASLKAGEEDPGTVAARGFYRAFFHDGPYGHPIEGDAASINAISAADLKGFARTHWVRGGLSIAVSGDVTAAKLTGWLKTAFGGLPATPPALPPPPVHPGAPGVHVIAMDVPQPSAIFGLPGLKRSDADFLAAYVANDILGGGGFASRLMNEVREKRGLTYGISSDLDPMRQGGVWIGSVASKRASMVETLKVIRSTMRSFVSAGPSEQELDDAKTYLTGAFALNFTSNVSTAAALNGFEAEGLPADYVSTRNEKIEAVTLEDVRRVSRRLFDPARLTVVVAGSLPQAQKPQN